MSTQKENFSKKANTEKTEASKKAKTSKCSICGEPAVRSVDGEPSCAAHIGQVYEHQVEDYTRARLPNNEWRKP